MMFVLGTNSLGKPIFFIAGNVCNIVFCFVYTFCPIQRDTNTDFLKCNRGTLAYASVLLPIKTMWQVRNWDRELDLWIFGGEKRKNPEPCCSN